MEYEDIKGLMGRLIAFERKRLYNLTQSERYTQINLIARKGERYLENCKMCQTPCSTGKNERKPICSRCTMIKIETGAAVQSDYCYVGILENLGYRYWLDGVIIREMEQLELLVLDFLSTASQDLLDKLNDIIPKYKNKYKDVFYFSDLLLLYEEVISLVAEDTSTNALSEEKIKFYYEYGMEVTKDIVSIIVVLTYLRNKKDKALYDEVSQRISNRWDCPYLFNYCLMCLTDNGQITMFDKVMQLYYDKFNKLTTYNQYNLLNKIAYIYLNDSSADKAAIYLIKCVEFLNKPDCRFIRCLRINTLRNLGTSYYFSQDYKKAIDCFMNLVSLDINRLRFNLILLISMLEKQKSFKEIENILSKENFYKINNERLKKIFKYYLVKYSKPITKEHAMELESIIVHDLNFLEKGTVHRNIIEEELNQWVTITRDYKMLFKFNQ